MVGIKPQGPRIYLIRLDMQAPGSGHVAKIPRAVKWSNRASSARHPGGIHWCETRRDAGQWDRGVSRPSFDFQEQKRFGRFFFKQLSIA